MVYIIDNTMVVDDGGNVAAAQDVLPFATFVKTRGHDLYISIRHSCPNVVPFKQVHDDNGNPINVENESIIFIHSGSQDGCDDFIKAHIDSCYFICYSGDTTPRENIRQYIHINPNNVIFDNLTSSIRTDDITKKWDIPRFIEAVKDDKQNCLSYLKKSGKPYLSAFSLLCVGYLIQHNCKGFQVAPQIAQSGSGIEKIETWQKVLGKSIDEAKANLELGKEHDNINKLLTAIYPNNEEKLLNINCDDMDAAYIQISSQ